MYLDMLVDIPDIKGKIIRMPKGDTVYINFEYGRVYNRERKYAIPKRVIIGKQSREDPTKMQPNQNYLTYILEVRRSEDAYVSGRSSCLKIGTFLVMDKILKEYGIPEILGKYFDAKKAGLFEDLMAYCLVCENNAATYYSDYAFEHPLFSENMQPDSDAQVAEFLLDLNDDHRTGFLRDWNEVYDRRDMIYLSFSASKKDCPAEGIELQGPGERGTETEDLTVQYAIGYDGRNAMPLFYGAYPGRVGTAAQIDFILGRLKEFGYEKVGFILDRGCFSKEAIRRMDTCGQGVLILMNSTMGVVKQVLFRIRGTFENDRAFSIPKYHVHGRTVKQKLFEDDEKERYFHICHSISREQDEREIAGGRLESWERLLRDAYRTGGEDVEDLLVGGEPSCEQDGIWAAAQEKRAAVRRELQLCGYFVLISSEPMTAEEALDLYFGRDVSEKLFCGDKYYLGSTSVREHFHECVSARSLVEFAALIIRSRLYTGLAAAADPTGEKRMDVIAALKELEKIELVRGVDRVYRLEHAVSKTQEAILKAFGIDAEYVKRESKQISEELKKGLPVMKRRC